MGFRYFSERVATKASKTVIWPESGALFIKIRFSYDGLKIVILRAVSSENEHMAAEWCIFSLSSPNQETIQDDIVLIESTPLSSDSLILMFFLLF